MPPGDREAPQSRVVEITGKEAPRTHDLQYLLKLTNLCPDEQAQGFIAELSNLGVATRYPIDFEKALSVFSKERTIAILSRTKETFEWIKKQLES